MDANWEKLPSELMVVIAHKLSSCHDYNRLAAVSQSWKSILSQLSEDEKPLLPPESPLLFLAEQVAKGAALSCELEEEDEDDEEEYEGDEEYYANLCDEPINRYDYQNNSVGNTRGLYSLSTRKTYYIELPEASGKLILGTDKGWLLTLGIDLQINLLHPLSRREISLPPMHTFPIQYEGCSPEEVTFRFVQKVTLSSEVLPKNISMVEKATPDPIVMTIYGECGYLGFARLGDKVWTNVDDGSFPKFEDIVYYNGKFYVVDGNGDVYVCNIGDVYKRGRQISLTKIALRPFTPSDFAGWYLVESESGLLLVVRIRKTRFIKPPRRMTPKYRTTNFLVWKLELKFSDACENPWGTFIQVNSLGDMALFVGRGSSVLLHSSEYINPNSIYFTDDMMELYNRIGGGHDMGIFNMESHTIEKIFEGKSIHPISPPLWYI